MTWAVDYIFSKLNHRYNILPTNSNANYLKVKELYNYCGQNLRKRWVVNGTILSCKNWAALVIDDKVAEIWLVK